MPCNSGYGDGGESSQSQPQKIIIEHRTEPQHYVPPFKPDHIMPCYTEHPNEANARIAREHLEQGHKIKHLEACLCALISELFVLMPKEADEFIKSASMRGMVDIMSVWNEHQLKDVSRLKKELSKFSEHEKSVLKTLLDENNSSNNT